MQPTLKVGTLAYWDTVAGLVPCKVIAIEAAIGGAPGYQATFKVTAARNPYHRGEIHTRMTRNVVPRRAVRFRKLGTRILPYTITV